MKIAKTFTCGRIQIKQSSIAQLFKTIQKILWHVKQRAVQKHALIEFEQYNQSKLKEASWYANTEL